MQVIKTKNRTEDSFPYYLILLIGAIIFVAPIAHIEFPKLNKNVQVFEQELDEKVELLDFKLNIARDKYDIGEISADQLITITDNLLLTQEKLIKTNKELLRAKIDKERIFGWKNLRIFLVGFGIRLPYLLFSIIISFLIVQLDTKNSNLKRVFLLLQLLCYTISFYVLIWCFWYSQDYPLSTYRFIAFAIAFLVALLSIYSVRYFKSNTSILKAKIRYVMGLMINQAIDKGHIKDEDKYEDEIIYPALKKLDE